MLLHALDPSESDMKESSFLLSLYCAFDVSMQISSPFSELS
jgi:hypothetical protein